MDVLNKTIKKLSEEEYRALIEHVSGKRKNKPYMVLEAARTRNASDSEMMELLQVNPSAYYTLKSRLNDKIAEVLSKNVQSPVNILMNEVTRVPAHLYGTNREFSIRALVDLEKQLIEYDLSSELISVYKTLAQLHLFSPDFKFYENLYNKHVAYSLAVSKAENLFYQFIHKMGIYQLTMDPVQLEDIVILKRELSNISEMYESHRLFVFYNIVNIYYHCNVREKREGLKGKEIEFEQTLQRIREIFEKYNQDTFYQNINFIVDFLTFEYYQKAQNPVRADHAYQQIKHLIPEICNKHAYNFFIIQFLNSKIEKFLQDNQPEVLSELNDCLLGGMDIYPEEIYHLVSFKKFIAISRFYNKDYQGAAKAINELRNTFSLKKYLITDLECKLFQALQYCILGEDGLCQQIVSSVKRQITEDESQFQNIRTFIKILKTALKPTDYRKKIKRITELWEDFKMQNTGSNQVLGFVKPDEMLIRKMSNPIKE